MSFNALTVFGYHPSEYYFRTQSTIIEDEENNILTTGHKLNALGSFPILTGQIGGILRMIPSISMMREKGEIDSYHMANVIRGVGEFLCLGPLFFIIDMIITIGRYIYRSFHPNHSVNEERTSFA